MTAQALGVTRPTVAGLLIRTMLHQTQQRTTIANQFATGPAEGAGEGQA